MIKDKRLVFLLVTTTILLQSKSASSGWVNPPIIVPMPQRDVCGGFSDSWSASCRRDRRGNMHYRNKVYDPNGNPIQRSRTPQKQQNLPSTPNPGYRTLNATPKSSYNALINEVWQIVDRSFVDPTFNDTDWQAVRTDLLSKSYSSENEAYVAIRVAIRRLGDPYTRFLEPTEFAQQSQNLSGQMSGIGVKMGLDKTTKAPTILEIFANSSAFKAGLKSGDQLLNVNGKSVYGLDIEKVSSLIRGKSGTLLKLKINRPGEKTFDVTLARQVIQLSAIASELKQEGSKRIGYIRLSQFSDRVDAQMKEAILSLEKQKAQAFVLDLRGNPGGLFKMAVSISRLWIDDGTIVKTVNRVGQNDTTKADRTAITKLPLAVLVDGNSASASEILAGALKDHRRAIVVGSRTFGHGTIQSVHKLPGGSGVIVTIAHHFTPNGTNITKKAIAPDVAIPLTEAQMKKLGQNPNLIASPADPQYVKAVETVTSQN